MIIYHIVHIDHIDAHSYVSYCAPYALCGKEFYNVK
jgi:hypothetical protein